MLQAIYLFKVGKTTYIYFLSASINSWFFSLYLSWAPVMGTIQSLVLWLEYHSNIFLFQAAGLPSHVVFRLDKWNFFDQSFLTKSKKIGLEVLIFTRLTKTIRSAVKEFKLFKTWILSYLKCWVIKCGSYC